MTLSTLSILLSVICLLFTKKTKLSSLLFIVTSLISIFWALYLTANYFSKDGLNLAALMHVKLIFNITTIKLFYLEILIFIFTVAIIIFIIYKSYSLDHKYTSYLSPYLSCLIIICCLVISTFSFLISPIVLSLRSIHYQYDTAKQNKIDDHLFNIGFLTPPITYIAPITKRNFIIIFAESLESTFFNNSIFPGLTPRLQQTFNKHKPMHITNINGVVMSNWTFGGMSAALCGLSYTPNYSINEQQLLSNPHIIGESCIGDALKKEGYQLSFTAGSDFGMEHKKKLLVNQGIHSIYTKEKIQTILNKDLPESKWGIYDDDLLKSSLTRIEKLNKSNTPFGEIVLTLDTHVPGLKTPACNNLKYANGKNSILNSIHCADNLLSNYIESIFALPNSENITVILLSDHLHPGSEPTIDSLKRKNRKNLFVILNSPISNESEINSVNASQLDIAPTILHSLGYSIGSFNLGRNVFNYSDIISKKTLVETLSYNRLNANIVPIRRKINAFWKRNN